MTRDRAAAMERAVAAYRRIFQVGMNATAIEMMVDLIHWHHQFVDESTEAGKLFAQVERRLAVKEAERESHRRGSEPAPADTATAASLMTEDASPMPAGDNSFAPPIMTAAQMREILNTAPAPYSHIHPNDIVEVVTGSTEPNIVFEQIDEMAEDSEF